MAYTRETFAAFLEEINNNKPGLELNLAYEYEFIQKNQQALLAAIKKSNRLTLDLSGIITSLDHNFLMGLFEAIQANPHIKINLSDWNLNLLTAVEIKKLCEIIKTHPHLEIDLSKTRVFTNSQLFIEIVEAIRGQQHPLKINLSSINSIYRAQMGWDTKVKGYKSFEIFCDVIENSKNLEIGMALNGLSDLGIDRLKELFTAIQKSQHLKINLAGNRLKENFPDAFEQLKTGVRQSTSIVITGDPEWDAELKKIVDNKHSLILKTLVSHGLPNEVVRTIAQKDGINATVKGVTLVGDLVANKNRNRLFPPASQSEQKDDSQKSLQPSNLSFR